MNRASNSFLARPALLVAVLLLAGTAHGGPAGLIGDSLHLTPADLAQRYSLSAPSRSQPFVDADRSVTRGFLTPYALEMRTARVGLRGSLGSFAIEQRWLGAPGTHQLALDPLTRHQLALASRHGLAHSAGMSWASPSLRGWSVGASYLRGGPPGWLLPAREDGRFYGTVSFTSGALAVSGSSAGNGDWNLLGRYTEGRNTWRLMLGRSEGYGEPVLNFGLDHRYSRALTFFAELHAEDEGAYVLPARRGYAGFNPEVRSGRGIMTGLRYDF